MIRGADGIGFVDRTAQDQDPEHEAGEAVVGGASLARELVRSLVDRLGPGHVEGDTLPVAKP